MLQKNNNTHVACRKLWSWLACNSACFTHVNGWTADRCRLQWMISVRNEKKIFHRCTIWFLTQLTFPHFWWSAQYVPSNSRNDIICKINSVTNGYKYISKIKIFIQNSGGGEIFFLYLLNSSKVKALHSSKFWHSLHSADCPWFRGI